MHDVYIYIYIIDIEKHRDNMTYMCVSLKYVYIYIYYRNLDIYGKRERERERYIYIYILCLGIMTTMSFGRMANQFLLYVLKDDLRCALLILVVTAMEAVYVLEQPSTSLLMLHERFVWLVETLGNLGIKVPSVLVSTFCHPRKIL